MPEEAHSRPAIVLSDDDIAMLVEALDSHEYRQLGSVLPRHDGLVWLPGDSVDSVDRHWQDESPTQEQSQAIEQVRRFRERAERIRSTRTDR